MFSQYVYLLNSDVGMSLSDRKLASKRIVEFPWRSRGKEFLSIWRERSFRIYNAVKEIQKFMRKRRKKIGQSKLRKKENLSFDFFGPGSLTTIRLFDEYFTY